MKIERLYYTVEQLADYWQVSIDDVMQLGLTDQLTFIAQADINYSDIDIIKRGEHLTIDFEDLANIYYAKEPFEVKAFIENSSIPSVLRGDSVTITYYNGIKRLIINASEVERFENENNQITTPTAKNSIPFFQNNDANAAYLEFWKNADKKDKQTQVTNKTVADWLIKNRNVSKTKAASIAKEIRPKWGFVGRKPNK